MFPDNFFPPDVRFEIEGEPTRQHYGVARSALVKTLQRAGVGGASHVTTWVNIDGVVISASVAGPIKTIRIVAPVIEPVLEKKPQLTQDERKFDSPPYFGMWTGWVRNTQPLEWHPTDYVSKAYKLPYAWQAPARLAPYTGAYKTTKVSAFTGAMKRWVQAIYGMGIVNDDSPLWVTGNKPNPTTRTIPMPYASGWARTHGIVKTGDKNHWLVLVDRNRGVLAMPLPMLRSTTTSNYRDRIATIGDIGTLRVLDEFGGLPSGEDFPDDEGYMNLMIAQGRGLRLMTAEQLGAYKDAETNYAGEGWAFSETTGEAHNTGFLWTTAHTGAPRASGPRRPFYNSPNFTGYLIFGGPEAQRQEHWMLDIFLSPHDKSQLALGNPVGIGTATMTTVHRGMLERHASVYMRVAGNHAGPVGVPVLGPAPYGDWADGQYWHYDRRGGLLVPADFTYNAGWRSINDLVTGWVTDEYTVHAGARLQRPQYVDSNLFGASIRVYCNGDTVERLKWVPAPFSLSSPGPGWRDDDVAYLGDLASINQGGQACYLAPVGLREGWALMKWRNETGVNKNMLVDSMIKMGGGSPGGFTLSVAPPGPVLVNGLFTIYVDFQADALINFEVATEATYHQYVASKHAAMYPNRRYGVEIAMYPGDGFRDYYRVGLPSGMEGAQPTHTNWTGSHHEAD